METPKYNLIEDRLREFLGRTCKHVSASNPDEFINRARFQNSSIDALDNLEHGEYCHFLLRNETYGPDRRKRILCEHYLVDKTTVSDLSFVKDLRNKYSHKTDIFLSKDQLADLLIVQRLVRGLGRLREQDDADRELLAKLDQHISELLIEVAQITMPKEFDTEGESTSFDENDQAVLHDIVINAVVEALPVYVPPPTSSGTESDLNHEVLTIILQLQAELNKLSKKSSDSKLLTRRVDEINTTISSGMSHLEKLVFELRGDLQALSINQSSDGDDDDETLYDDEQEDEEAYVLLKNQINEMVGAAVASRLANPPLSSEDARDMLIKLRKRIWKATGEGPSPEGLLKRTMIDAFLFYHPKSQEEAIENMGYDLQRVSESQLPYIEDVIAIVSRVDDTAF